MKKSFRVVNLIGMIVLLAAAFGGVTPAKANPTVFINEIHYDNTGTDSGEAIEIAGPAGTDLSGWSLVLYNGNGGGAYNTTAMSGSIPDMGTGFGFVVVTYATNGIQNGSPDGLALVDNANNVVQFLSYEGSFTAVGGPADGMTSVDIGVSEPSTTPIGFSLQLTGTGTTYDDFTWEAAAANTFGIVNTDQAFDEGQPAIVINEVDADTPGTDVLEFVELYDGGDGNTPLDGLVLVFYNGNGDTSYAAFDLDGFSTDSNGNFVLGNTGVAPTPVIIFGSNGLQNGADAVALYQGDATDFPNATSVTTANLIDAVVYDTNDGDDAGLLVLVNAGQSQVNEGGGGDKDNHSNQRCPNGSGGPRNTDTYTQTVSTPGGINNCPVSITPIYNIQYATDPLGDSPLKNQSGVTTEGIVTAIFDNGYFIEDPAGGAWNGLWVYDPTYSPVLGDLVRLNGTVSEYYNLTQLGSLISYEVLSSGNPIPGPDVIASGDVSQEQWEGVLVKVAGVTVTNPNLGYGEWLVSDGSGDVIIDDKGSYSYTPSLGDPLVYVIGVLDYSYGAFKIQPRDDDDIKLSLCGYPATLIHDVQGSGSTSPLNGTSEVVIEGVVVGDFQTSSHLRGFFLQEEDADADTDPITSEGIFVYDGSTPAFDVNVGDVIRVTGEVTEYYGLTELTNITDIETCGAGTASEATVPLPVSSLDDWEPYEGMLVSFADTLYVTDNYNLGQYGEVTLSVDDRLDNPTNVAAPGAPAIALKDLNRRSQIQLDDGSGIQNPLPLPPYLGANNTLRAGDAVHGITGALGYAYGVYELHPTELVAFTRENDRPLNPPSVGGSLKIASFNVLNYFTTLDDSGPICGPSGDQDCRGADNAFEFTQQRNKIIDAIVKLNADVIGLMEIENNATVAIQDFVDGLNAVEGAGTYAFINTGTIGSDAIKVAFLYKPGSVTPIGDFEILDSSVDPEFLDDRNRPALAQTFQENGTDDLLTVVVNHLKSKGSDCDDIGDPDTGDGQGNCNQTRTSAAEALADWLVTDPTESGSNDFLIIGDLNAYAMEDPVAALEDAGYEDLIETFEGFGAYSYVYFGEAGYLDHALSSPSLLSRVTDAGFWHINADEPNALNYNDYNQPSLYNPDPYRSSDHDPVIVGICEATPPLVEIVVTPDTLWPANHKYVEVIAEVSVTDADPNATVTLISVTSNEPDEGLGDGDTADDIVILDDFTFELRAERAGNGEGRIYTITYEVTDACGNSTTASADVTVPHNQDKNKDSSGEADSLDLPSATEAIVPEPTEEPSDKDKKDK